MRQVIWLFSTVTPSPSATSRSTCGPGGSVACMVRPGIAAACASLRQQCPRGRHCSRHPAPPGRAALQALGLQATWPCAPFAAQAHLEVQVAAAADVRLVVQVVLHVLVGCRTITMSRIEDCVSGHVGHTAGAAAHPSPEPRSGATCRRRRCPARSRPPSMRPCTMWSVSPTSASHSMLAVSCGRGHRQQAGVLTLTACAAVRTAAPGCKA